MQVYLKKQSCHDLNDRHSNKSTNRSSLLLGYFLFPEERLFQIFGGYHDSLHHICSVIINRQYISTHSMFRQQPSFNTSVM